MKRYTPNKTLGQKDRASNSCCKGFIKEEKKIQQSFEVKTKNTPPKTLKMAMQKYSHTVSTTCNHEEYARQTTFQTPKNVTLKFRTNSLGSTNYPPVQNRLELSFSKQINAPLFCEVVNPLVRLKQRCKISRIKNRNPYLSLRGAQSENFNVNSPIINKNLFKECLKADKKVEKIEQLQESSLNSQIQRYKKEYNVLLEQYSKLKQQKQTNALLYWKIIEQLKVKQAELVQLQALRRQQIEELQSEIQKMIQQKNLECD